MQSSESGIYLQDVDDTELVNGSSLRDRTDVGTVLSPMRNPSGEIMYETPMLSRAGLLMKQLLDFWRKSCHNEQEQPMLGPLLAWGCWGINDRKAGHGTWSRGRSDWHGERLDRALRLRTVDWALG